MESLLLDRFFATLNSGDWDSLDGLLAEDVIFEEVAGTGLPSRNALKEELAVLRSGLPDLSFRPVRVEPAGDRLYVEFRAMGAHRGELLRVAPTGTFVILSGVFNLAISSGRISRLRLTIDFAGLRRQLLQAARRP
jgi:predicted ester cyclase